MLARLKNKSFPFGVALLAFCLNLWMALCFPVIDDEAYYWNWAQQLDFGYFDHPPLVAWFIALGDFWTKQELALRFFNAFLGAGTFFFLTLLAHPKTTGQKWLWVVILFSNVLLAVYGFITTPDGVLLFFTIFYLWVLHQKSVLSKAGFILLIAFTSAGLLYSKYHGVLVVGFSGLALLRNLRNEIPWLLGILLGGLLFVPHLVWQFQNDWVSFAYHLSDRTQNEGFELRFVLEFLLNFLWAGSPFILVFMLIAFFKSDWKKRMTAVYVAICMGVFLVFLISTAGRATQPQWIALIFPILSLLTFLYYQKKKHAWLIRLGALGMVLLFGVRIMMSFPEPLVKTPYHGTRQFMQAAGKLSGIAVWEKYQSTSLYNFYNAPKKAVNYATLGNRKSQYDLWKSPAQMEGESIRYFSQYASSWPDSLVWDNNKQTVYYHRTIDSIRTFADLQIELLARKQKSDSTYLSLRFTNTSERQNMVYHPQQEISFVLRYMQSRYEALYTQKLKIPAFKLPPKASIKLNVNYLEWDSVGVYKGYIGTKPAVLPDRMKSDWIDFEVK